MRVIGEVFVEEPIGRPVEIPLEWPRPDSSSVRDRSIGAVARTGFMSTGSFFQRVFGTGGRRDSVEVARLAFFACRGCTSVVSGDALAQSGISNGCYKWGQSREISVFT